MKRLRYAFVLTLAALLALPALAQQSDQAAPKKEKRVLTEDDLAATRPAPDPQPSSEEKKDGENKDGEGPGADPADTRSESEKAADEVKKWDGEEKLLQKKLATLEEKLSKETSEFRQQMYREALDNQQITLREFRDKKAAAEKRLAESKEKEGDSGQQAAPKQENPQ